MQCRSDGAIFPSHISAATSLKYPWRVISEDDKLDRELIFKEPKDKQIILE